MANESFFFQLIDFTICNAWLLYQLEHIKEFPGEKYLDLYDFKRYVSECWMKQNECTAYRRLRKSEGRSVSRVPRPVRFDEKGHWPIVLMDIIIDNAVHFAKG